MSGLLIDGQLIPVPGVTMIPSFVAGAQACREMLACFVEQGGDPITAASIRANWNPSWGADPGRPEPGQEGQP